MLDEVDIERLINSHYANLPKDRSDWPITPSSFGACPRRLALALEGVPMAPPGPESARVFELGHQRGAALAEALSSRVLSQDAEWPAWVPIGLFGDEALRVYDKAHEYFPGAPVHLRDGQLFIEGAADHVIHHNRAHVTLIDYKTAGGYGFGKLATDGVSIEYAIQVWAYRSSLLEIYETVDAFLVYECKDTNAAKGHVGGEIKAMRVEGQDVEHAYEVTLSKIRRILVEWATKGHAQVSPPYDIGGKSGRAKELPWQCNFCPIGPVIGECYGTVEDRSKRPNRKKYYLN